MQLLGFEELDRLVGRLPKFDADGARSQPSAERRVPAAQATQAPPLTRPFAVLSLFDGMGTVWHVIEGIVREHACAHVADAGLALGGVDGGEFGVGGAYELGRPA